MALHGTSKQYICQRLKDQGETALLTAVQAGTITAMAAAVSLGWVKRPPGMGGSTHKAKRIAHQLRTITGAGLSAGEKMELQYGPSPTQGSLFSSREQLESAWAACRDELLARANPGRRPAIWWELEASSLGLKWPGYFSERSYLFEAGALSAEEKATLKTEWRAEFERAYEPDFTYIGDPDEILHGAEARQKHFAFADIPRSLICRWEAARRRRKKKAPLDEQRGAAT
jgi:hypothetical protein